MRGRRLSVRKPIAKAPRGRRADSDHLRFITEEKRPKASGFPKGGIAMRQSSVDPVLLQKFTRPKESAAETPKLKDESPQVQPKPKPREQPAPPFPEQAQPKPGTESKMTPKPRYNAPLYK